MLSDIWQDFLKIVKEEVGSRVVETWLKAVSLEQWDLDCKTIYVKAPNLFVKEWIASKYTALFQLHLSRLLNTSEVRVIFLCETEEKAEKKQSLTTIIPAQKSVEIDQSQYQVTKKNYHYQYGKLNPSYRFDTFVVGPNNSLSYAAAYAVTEASGTLYNPLYIYGGSGLGKTHLLHAIGNALQEREEKLVVLYQTADRFVNEFINAIRFNKYHQFQQKYRDLDVLLIDDIQFLSGKEQTQEAFFHIFNAFYDAHKQIVFSSDIFPRQIEGLAERLRSRLEWGLVTDIHKPPLETKIAILKKKAAIHGEILNDEIAEYVAHKADSNVRELEGSLIRILAFASLTKQPLSLELAQKVLAGQETKKEELSIDFNKITHQVCKRYSYRLSDLRSTSRAKELSLVRQIAMYLMKKMTDKSLREIGTFLGRKDHSTVIHAFEKIEQTVKKDALFGSTLKALEEDILR